MTEDTPARSNNYMQNIDKQYILSGSPLLTSKSKVAFAVILALIFAAALAGMVTLGASALIGAYEWVFYVGLGCLATFYLLTRLNLKTSFRWFQMGAMMFAALQTAFVAALLNDLSPRPLQTVGFVEEGVKILPALLLYVFLPNLVRTRKDAMVFGALGGLGFNLLEIALYISQTLIKGEMTTIETIYVHTTRLGLLGFGTHIIWSMFVGLGLGMTVESKNDGWRKWRPFILVYLLTAVTHSAYDSGLIGLALIASIAIVIIAKREPLVFEGMRVEDAGHPGTLREAMVLEHYLYNTVYILILLVQLFRASGREQELTVKQLASESDAVVSDDEKSLIAAEGRWRSRRYTNYPKAVGRRIIKLQNLLAREKRWATVLSGASRLLTD